MTTTTAYASQSAGDIQTDAKAREQGLSEARLWLKKIDRAKADPVWVKWRDDSRKAIAAYENGEIDGKVMAGANLFHANVETKSPAIYNSAPIPDIRVRFDDDKPDAKSACDVLERVASYDLDQCAVDDVLSDAVRKADIVGWGIIRVRYRAQTANVPQVDGEGQPLMGEDGQPQMVPEVISDEVWPSIWPWDRYIVGPCRQWSDRPWEAFEHDMTEDELIALNPQYPVDELGFSDAQKYAQKAAGSGDQPADEQKGIYKTVKVYEIWDKARRVVWWVTPAADDRESQLAPSTLALVQVHPDPYRLKDFFAVPSPVRQTRRMDSPVPQVQYAIHKSLFDEFEAVSRRISKLTTMLKLVGLYDATMKADVSRLRDMLDGEFLAAEAGHLFAAGSQGGLEKAILFWPVEKIIVVVRELVQHREQIKALIWEATGIADIMRGATDANETLGAQELKTQWGSLRVKEFQSSTARSARDIIRLMIEIRANLTEWDRLKELSGLDFQPKPEEIEALSAQMMQQAQAAAQQQAQAQPPQMDPMTGQPAPAEPMQPPQIDEQAIRAQATQQAQQQAAEFEQRVAGIVKSPHRHLVIDIETDSTIRNDVARAQEQFSQLLAMTGQWATGVMPVIQLMPETRVPWFQLLESQMSKYGLNKGGEDALAKLKEAAAAPPQLPGSAPANPQQMEHEMGMADKQAQMQQADNDVKLKLGEQKMQAASQGLQIKQAEAEIDDAAADKQLDRDRILMELQQLLGAGAPQRGPANGAGRQQQPMNGGMA